MTTRVKVSLADFLEMPETEPPSELIDGEVLQKVAPSIFHARIVARMNRLLDEYLERSGEALVLSEARHLNVAEGRAFLPDVSVSLRSSLPSIRAAQRRGGIPVAPDFAIEVLSPGDSPGRVLEKVAFYMRAGTRLLWVIDPEMETITSHRPGESPTVHASGELPARPVLAGFVLDVERLFAILHEGEDGDGEP